MLSTGQFEDEGLRFMRAKTKVDIMNANLNALLEIIFLIDFSRKRSYRLVSLSLNP